MYPVPRLFWQLWRHRKDRPASPFDTHVSQHICWPWDLDIWWELNNGRTLTLYDLGRIPMARHSGLFQVLKANGWGLTVAGSTVRYRRRVRAFDRLTMKSRLVGWDARFLYMEQAMFKSDGECSSHVLIRSAIVGPKGMVPPAEVMTALGRDIAAPPLPDWIAAWIAADAKRPWPPMGDA